MTATIKATHVIIGGVVFPWAAKAPYVAAGKSLLGALEYNDEHDLIKCHVCGGWFMRVGRHVSHSDGISGAEYKREFGLMKGTALCTPSFRVRLSRHARHAKIGDATRLPHRKTLDMPSRSGSAEGRNLKNLCQAQLRHRVLQLAVSLNGTPTVNDLRTAGIHGRAIQTAFGMTASAFMRSLGLTPNRPKTGHSNGHSKTLRQPLPPQNQILRSAEAGVFAP
jgi:predicted transcriptional regulator